MWTMMRPPSALPAMPAPTAPRLLHASLHWSANHSSMKLGTSEHVREITMQLASCLMASLL